MNDEKILDVLKVKNNSLFHQQEKTKHKATDLLPIVGEFFPEYTIHDIRHSEEIIKNLDTIIPDKLKEKLTENELYCLVNAAYLHDIGMVHFPEILDQFFIEEFSRFTITKKLTDPNLEEKEILKQFIRDYHHEISEKYINENHSDLKLNDSSYACFIGRICKGHRKSVLSDEESFPCDRGINDSTINLPLLSALLELGDELDMTCKRTPLIIWNTKRPTNPISQENWIKSLIIESIHYAPKDNTHLLATARFTKDIDFNITPKYDIARALYMQQEKIQEKLRDLPNYLHNYYGFEKDFPRIFSTKIGNLYVKEYIQKNYPEIAEFIL